MADALGLDEHKKPNDSVWRNGMKDQGFINIDIAKILNLVAEIPFPQKNPLRDPPIDKWEEAFQQDIHILILFQTKMFLAKLGTPVTVPYPPQSLLFRCRQTNQDSQLSSNSYFRYYRFIFSCSLFN